MNNASGVSNNSRVTISGGWDRTNMSTQTGITFLDGGNGNNYGLYMNYNYYYSFNNLGMVRYGNGIYFNGAAYCEFTGNLYAIDCYNGNISFFWSDYLTGTPKFITSGGSTNISGGQSQLNTNSYIPSFYVSGGYDAIQIQNVSGCYFDTINAYYGLFRTLSLSNCNSNTISNLECRYSGANFYYNDSFSLSYSNKNIFTNLNTSHIMYGFYVSNSNENIVKNINSINDYLTLGSTDSIYSVYIQSGIKNYILGGSVDKQINIVTELYTKNLEFTTSNEYSLNTGAIAYSKNHDNVSNSNKTFFPNGRFEQSTEYRHTASGYSWKFLIQTSSYTSTSPAEIPLAKVAAQANSQVTLKIWVYRNGTGIVGGLKVKGGFVGGINNDIVSYGTAYINAWEELTITCTPTEDAVLDVRAVAYYNGNTSNYVWIDDFSASQ